MFTTSAFSASERVANTAQIRDMGGSGVESGMGGGTSAGLGVMMRILGDEAAEVLDKGAGSPLQSHAMCPRLQQRKQMPSFLYASLSASVSFLRRTGEVVLVWVLTGVVGGFTTHVSLEYSLALRHWRSNRLVSS